MLFLKNYKRKHKLNKKKLILQNNKIFQINKTIFNLVPNSLEDN